MCDACKVLLPQMLSSWQSEAQNCVSHCKICETPYRVPKVCDVLLVLRDLSLQSCLALRPFVLHQGEYLRPHRQGCRRAAVAPPPAKRQARSLRHRRGGRRGAPPSPRRPLRRRCAAAAAHSRVSSASRGGGSRTRRRPRPRPSPRRGLRPCRASQTASTPAPLPQSGRPGQHRRPRLLVRAGGVRPCRAP